MVVTEVVLRRSAQVAEEEVAKKECWLYEVPESGEEQRGLCVSEKDEEIVEVEAVRTAGTVTSTYERPHSETEDLPPYNKLIV